MFTDGVGERLEEGGAEGEPCTKIAGMRENMQSDIYEKPQRETGERGEGDLCLWVVEELMEVEEEGFSRASVMLGSLGGWTEGEKEGKSQLGVKHGGVCVSERGRGKLRRLPV